MQGYFEPFYRSIYVVSIFALFLLMSSCTKNCTIGQHTKDSRLSNCACGQDFISTVISVPSDQTNIVYYAGTSNNVFVLVHQTSETRRIWNLLDANIDKSIWRTFSEDSKNWIVVKRDEEDEFRYWDWQREIEDFVQRQSEKSALVMHCSTFYKVDGNLTDDNACVRIVEVFSVETTLCDVLKKGDKICTEQLYDGSKENRERIISEARRKGNTIVDKRLQNRGLCFAYWEKGKFISSKELPSERLFIIDNEIVAPFEVAWNLAYDGWIHFDENVAVQAYRRRVEQTRQGDKE